MNEDDNDDVVKKPFFSTFGQQNLKPPSLCLPQNKNTPSYKTTIKPLFIYAPCKYDHKAYRLASQVYRAINNDRDKKKNTEDGSIERAESSKKKTSGKVNENLSGKGRGSATKNENLKASLKSHTAAHSTENYNEDPIKDSDNDISDGAVNDDYHEDDEDDEREPEITKRLSFRLVFQTLKYEKYLKTMLKSSKFFDHCPELKDLEAEVMLVACDYVERNFQKKLEMDSDEVFISVEVAVYKHKSKLASALAKCRISGCVLSLDAFLPESVRKNDKIASELLVSCWVNSFKTDLQRVKEILVRDGYTELSGFSVRNLVSFKEDDLCMNINEMIEKDVSVVKNNNGNIERSDPATSEADSKSNNININSNNINNNSGNNNSGNSNNNNNSNNNSSNNNSGNSSNSSGNSNNNSIIIKENYFLSDDHCNDVLFFHSNQLNSLERSDLVVQKMLVMQDKSSSIGITALHAVLGDEDDVVFINVDMAISVSHLASLMHSSSSSKPPTISLLNPASSSQTSFSVIYAFGVTSEKQIRQCQRNLRLLGASKMVSVREDNFLETNYDLEPFKNIKVIYVNAVCTKSGVIDAVNFIVSEGLDSSILSDLSGGFTDNTKLDYIKATNQAILNHALMFPCLQTLVYCTRSVFPSENEAFIQEVVDNFNSTQLTGRPYKITPPGLKFSEADVENDSPLNGKHLLFDSCITTSACFVAVVSREAEDPQEVAKNILARAAAKGIIVKDK